MAPVLETLFMLTTLLKPTSTHLITLKPVPRVIPLTLAMEGYSVKEVLETTKKISGSKFIAKVSTRRKGDIPSLISDPSQIKKKVGWVPKNNDLNLIIKTAIKWEEGLQH